MKSGDVLGHENMGEVVEVGSENKKLKVGDRVVVPFTISCGECFFCKNGFYSGCERKHPDLQASGAPLGQCPPAGLFGYSHLCGGYAGGQAEYLRVPYANVGPLKVPDNLSDEQALFLSDIFPTGYMGAEFCDLKGGETVAIWGCGPVGQFAIRSAFLLGAERVIAIDTVPERLALARAAGAETLDFLAVATLTDAIMEKTKGRGADACIDAVGTEAVSATSSSGFPQLRLDQGRAFHGNGSPSRAASADPLLPKLRRGVPASACMAASSTRSRWARRSIAVSLSAWPRRRCSAICRSS